MSSDPLASVITQVQPGQGAPHARGPGPARPTKVAKPGTAKAAAQQQAAAAAAAPGGSGERKKKKKKKVKRRTNDDEAAQAQQDPQTSTSATSATKPSTNDQQHSAQASSTLAGTVTTIADAQVGGTPGAAGVGETDAAAQLQSAPTHEQDMTMAAQVLQTTTDDEPQKRSPATPSGHKGDLTSSTVKGSSRTPSVPPKTVGSAGASPPPTATQSKRKKSSLSKLIAILTCSTGSASMAADEKSSGSRPDGENIEMRSGLGKTNRDGTSGAGGAKGNSTATSAPSSGVPASKSGKVGGRGRNRIGAAAAASSKGENSRLAPPIKTRSGRSGSRSSSTRNSLDRRSETGIVAPAPGTPTAGGGTMLPREETGDVMSGAVVPPGSSFVTPDSKRGSAAGTPSKRGSRAEGESDDESDEDEDGSEEEVTDEETDDEEGSDGLDPEYIDDEELNEEQRLIAQGGIGIPRDEFGNEHPLLPALGGIDTGRKCLVLDLDETLVHSSFKMITNADFIVPVEIEGTIHNVYVIKRPGVDEFMRRMGEIYEVVVFTASLSKYADPVLDILDIHRVVRHRLFRESCYNHRGNYVKDLSQLGRPISESIIIDNSPASYIFHPNNAVPISSWFNDPHDTELTDLCPFLADLCEVGDVRAVLDGGL